MLTGFFVTKEPCRSPDAGDRMCNGLRVLLVGDPNGDALRRDGELSCSGCLAEGLLLLSVSGD